MSLSLAPAPARASLAAASAAASRGASRAGSAAAAAPLGAGQAPVLFSLLPGALGLTPALPAAPAPCVLGPAALPLLPAAAPLAAAAPEAALAALDPAAAELRTRQLQLPLPGQGLGPAAAALAQDYALADLAELFDGIKRPSLLGDALRLRLGKGSPLAALGLDEEGALLDWVRLYRPSKLKRVQAALLSWQSLSSAQQAWLQGHGRTAAGWDRQLPRDRDMNDWAQTELAAWKLRPPLSGTRDFRGFWRETQSLSRALAHEDRGALSLAYSRLKTELKLRLELQKRLAQGEDASARELLAALERGSGLPVSERLAALAEALAAHPDAAVRPRLRAAFDGWRRSRGRVDLSGMTELPAAARDALLDELRGTPQGDAALSLLPPGDAPKIAVADIGGIALFADGRISFDRSFLESWLSARGGTAQALQDDPEARRELARYMADTLVHESTHLRQSSQRKQAGLPAGFTQEDEVEAFLAQREFLRAKKGSWPASAWESAADKHRALLGGPDLDPTDFVRKVMFRYPTTPSLRGRLASALWKISRVQEALERGAAAPSEDPAGITEDWLSAVFSMKDDRTAPLLRAMSLTRMSAVRDYLTRWVLAAARWHQRLRERLAQAR